jgi:DNA-binding CsgD family transcriptional regulator
LFSCQKEIPMLPRSPTKPPKVSDPARAKTAARVPAGGDAAVDQLLKRLVARAAPEARRPAHRSLGGAADEPVLLDTEVDGVRCVLVRAGSARPVEPPPALAPASSTLPRRQRPSLSPREQEIVRMVAQGYPNKIIADVLEISTWTVGTHLRRIFAKLGVTARAAMVARILEEGLLAPPPADPPRQP